MLRTLSGRFLVLTIIFVMLAEVLIFVPSIARFREDYLLSRLERAQIASLALLADDMISADLEAELLRNAEVFNVVLRRNELRQLMLQSPVPQPIYATYDLRQASAFALIRDAMASLVNRENRVIRVIGNPVREAGLLIEVTMETGPLRDAMLGYGIRILALSAVISVFTAVLLFLAVQVFLVRPIKGVVRAVQSYAENPEDARRIIVPSAGVTELREAEEALAKMQQDLTGALKQKQRLAQLGEAVAKISHDLRNILTSAQLFGDRIETSTDPSVQRLAPKLVNQITRAVHLTESTLAFGKAEEPPPRLARVALADIVADVLDSERLAITDGQDISLAADVPATMVVRVDAEQMYRVLSNLVRNARQALAQSGSGGEISISATEAPSAWVIRVADTGPGLPAKARQHLFTPFQGGARKGGSGLGLAISAELVRGHGGQLELEDSSATGTVFKITLPNSDVSQTL
jgi:signal transduction histidine kinase